MCQTANNFGMQEEHQHYPTHQERQLIKKTGYGSTERERDRERQTGIKREKDGGREDAALIL